MKFIISISVVVFLGLLVGPADAFDCARAETKGELAICADNSLKELDDALSKAYADVKKLSTIPEQKMLALAQRRWIGEREDCPQSPSGLVKCVKDTTHDRLNLFLGKAESGIGIDDRMIPVFIVQEGSEKSFDLDITLLRFAAVKTPAEKLFNGIAKKISDSAILGEHGQDSGGSIYAREDTMSLSYAAPRLLSVKHSFYSDEGGAHGNGGIENFNINMMTGRLIEIGDVLPEPAAVKIASQCKTQIIAQKKIRFEGQPYDPASDSFLNDDIIAEHIATLSRWRIFESEVEISFDSYAIGSYAEGTYECKLPMQDLKAVALDDAPLP